jgi:hypothetical protein
MLARRAAALLVIN